MWQRLKFWRQFSLKTLLLAMLVAAVFCGAYRLGFHAGRSERMAAQNASYGALVQMLSASFAPMVLDDSSAGTAMPYPLIDVDGTIYVSGPSGSGKFTVITADVDRTSGVQEKDAESP